MVDDPNPKFVFAEEQALFPSIACLPSFYFRAQAVEGGSSWDGRGLLRSFVRRALLLRWSFYHLRRTISGSKGGSLLSGLGRAKGEKSAA